MQLYSIIKTDRGKPVGKGSNKKIEIELRSGSAQDSRIDYQLEFSREGLQVKDNRECKAKA